MKHLRRTKIVATLGPISSTKQAIKDLIDTGVDYFRLNFSHGDHKSHLINIQTIRTLAKQKNKSIGILADLQGPKIRIGEIDGGGIDIKPGDNLTITTNPIIGNKEMVSTTYSNLPVDVKSGDRILLDDGLISLEVKSINLYKNEIECEVIYGGMLKSKKGINLPEVNVSVPAFTEQDKVNAIFSIEHDVDYFALSFVRHADDIKPLKDLIKKMGKDIPVIAKIETPFALLNLDEIIVNADGLMVARGDLGVEIPAERVPVTQKNIIKKCNRAGKPVITATQMLESMIQKPIPTRAEVSDVANAILDGTDAIMLSGETAVGSYALKAVQKMVDIAIEIETTSPILYLRRHGMDKLPENDVEEAIAFSACDIDKTLKSKAIIGWTQNGRAIQLISKFHPVSPIIALTNSEKIAQKVQLLWGAFPKVIPLGSKKLNDWTLLCQHLVDEKIIKASGLVVITETESPIHKDKINCLKVLNLF